MVSYQKNLNRIFYYSKRNTIFESLSMDGNAFSNLLCSFGYQRADEFSDIYQNFRIYALYIKKKKD